MRKLILAGLGLAVLSGCGGPATVSVSNPDQVQIECGLRDFIHGTTSVLTTTSAAAPTIKIERDQVPAEGVDVYCRRLQGQIPGAFTVTLFEGGRQVEHQGNNTITVDPDPDNDGLNLVHPYCTNAEFDANGFCTIDTLFVHIYP